MVVQNSKDSCSQNNKSDIMSIRFIELRPSTAGLWKASCSDKWYNKDKFIIEVCVRDMVMYKFHIQRGQVVEWKNGRLVAKGDSGVSTLRKEHPGYPWPLPFYTPETGTWELTINVDGIATIKGALTEIGEFVSIGDADGH